MRIVGGLALTRISVRAASDGCTRPDDDDDFLGGHAVPCPRHTDSDGEVKIAEKSGEAKVTEAITFKKNCALIFDCGGLGVVFTYNSLLAQYYPDLLHLPTINGICTARETPLRCGEDFGARTTVAKCNMEFGRFTKNTPGASHRPRLL